MNPQLLWSALIFPFQPEEKGRVLLESPLKQFGLVFLLVGVFWLWSMSAGWQGASSMLDITMGLVSSALSIWMTSQLLQMIGVHIRFVDLLKLGVSSSLLLMVLAPFLIPNQVMAGTGGLALTVVMFIVMFWSIGAYCIALGRYFQRSPWAIFGISVLAGILISILGFVLGALGLPMDAWQGFNTVYLKPN